MLITSQVQLNNYITSKIRLALTFTMDELLEKLQEIIMDEVYNAYEPEWYSRTYDVINNWTTTKPIVLNHFVESTLAFTKPIRHGGFPNLHHGYSELNNNSMLEVINDGKIGDIFGFPNIGARPFWNVFELYVETNFTKILKENLSKLGLEVR